MLFKQDVASIYIMKTILAIDVGLKNLSYCVLSAGVSTNTDVSTNTNVSTGMNIIEWKNVCVMDKNCKKASIEEITEAVLTKLLELFDSDTSIDIVVIENQPMLKNGMMKTVSVIIYTYFNMLKVMYGNVKEVKFISATNKLKCKKALELAKTATNYKDRKSISVEVARKYLECIAPDKLEWFNSQAKSDDLADCALFAVYMAERYAF